MKPTAPPVNRGRPGQGTGAILLQNLFHDFEAVLHAVVASAGLRSAHGSELLDDLAVFEHLDAVAGLPDDRARIAADERIAPEVFAAFDRFEQKRFALPANFAVGRERRFKIGQQAGA